MAIDFELAKAIAETEISKIAINDGDVYSIVDSQSAEYLCGWVFFYDTLDFVQTGNFASKLAGNVPLLVTRDGEPRFLSIEWQGEVEAIDEMCRSKHAR